MTLLRNTGRNPDPKWQFLPQKRVDEWRRKAMANLHNKEGRQVEVGVITEAHHSGWDRSDVDAAGNPILEKPAAEKPREGRETVGIIAKDMAEMMLRLRANDPEAFRQKVELMKQTGGLSHLTDEETEQAVVELCRKVAQMEVKQVYESMGLLGKA